MNKIYLLVVVAALSSGCLKEMPVSNSKGPSGVGELVVPASFDWNTTSDNVVCNVASETVARVSVATSATGESFATFFAGGTMKPVALSIPTAVNTLYMRYETTEGKMSAPQAVSVKSNAVSYAISGGNRPFDDSDMEFVNELATVYIPAFDFENWGTILFEDMWPGKGDYDFNDFVFNYKIRLRMSTGNTVPIMEVLLRTKAVGGSFPYELFLQMHGVTYDQIFLIEQMGVYNTLDASMTLLPPTDPNKNRALFRFDGIKQNPNNPAGAIWLNTEQGYELADDKLIEFGFKIFFKNNIDLDNLNFAGLDFFLGQMRDGTFGPEIHRCNYEPINTDYYFSNALYLGRDYYKTKDNLIWGVNVPVDIRHAYEKGNFLKAYPEFAAWAQSGGKVSKDWYTRGVDEHLVRKR